MNEEVATVAYLAEFLKNLTDDGYGDMKIKTKNGDYIHKDEIFVYYPDREFVIKGFIFNQPMTERMKRFSERIDEEVREFYDD